MSDSHKISQGARFSFQQDPEQIPLILSHAVDYRGDIQITLRSGQNIEGYVFNYNSNSDSPSITLFPKNSVDKQKILLEDIQEIYFSGRDPAHGNQWESWVKKYKEREEALHRGENIQEDISLYPQDLEKED